MATYYINKSAKTKAAFGLTVTRDRNVFEFSWRQGDSNYDRGCRVFYRFYTYVYDTKKKKYESKVSGWTYFPSKSTWTRGDITSVRIAVDFTKYTPYNRKNLLNAIEFGVVGWRATETVDKTINKGQDTQVITTTYDASANVYKKYTFGFPRKPVVTQALENDPDWDTTRFTWDVTESDSDARVFTRVEYESLALKNSGKAAKDVKYTSANASAHGYGWLTGTGIANSSRAIQEDSAAIFANPDNASSYTRYFRIRAIGPRGASDWTYGKHVYARPSRPLNVTPKAVDYGNTGYIATVSWEEAAPATHPVDYLTVQYCKAVPAARCALPANVSWQDAYTVNDTSKKDRATFNVDGKLADNECMYARVVATHDHNDTSSQGVRFKGMGKLAAPTIQSVSVGTRNVEITVKNNASEVPDSAVRIYYREQTATKKDSTKYNTSGNWKRLGDITTFDSGGVGSANFAFPNVKDTSKIGISARAYCYKEDGTEAMGSDRTSASTNLPVAPTVTSVTRGTEAGTAVIKWSWNWSDATGAEVTWADSSDAWDSNEQPSSFTVEDENKARLVIKGLEMGKTWYFRVRLLKDDGDTTINTPWSEQTSLSILDYTTPPETPALVVEPDVVTSKGNFTFYWSYASEDGMGQSCVQFQMATSEEEEKRNLPYSNSNRGGYRHLVTYNRTTQNIQRKLSNFTGFEEANRRMAVGNTYFVRCRTKSDAGVWSEFSDWEAITFVVPPVAGISVVSTSALSQQTITGTLDVDETDSGESTTTRTAWVLSLMPFTIRVTGAGEGGESTLLIERAQDYESHRPDESVWTGREGEAVFIAHADSSDNSYTDFVVNRADIAGYLDDGAVYNIVATVEDANGLTSTARIDGVEVHWAHQAIVPEATAEVLDDYAMKITVAVPSGALASDRFDLYRLTADKPELIVENGELGTPYVDPYPAIGTHCGHRVVYKTANGDYTTAEGSIAWVDLTPEDDDNIYTNWTQAPEIDEYAIIIDFDGKRVNLPYDIAITNSWEKDFTETKYLGGSVVGDWNPAVSRSTSVNTASLVVYDWSSIALLRQLAVYAGVCHVRMPDGSSFAADIQVSEDREKGEGRAVSRFSFAITRVDAQTLDGVTLEEWNSDKGNS